jgi:hypothetical protein
MNPPKHDEIASKIIIHDDQGHALHRGELPYR